MFDIIAATALGAGYAVVAATLAAFAPLSPRRRRMLLAGIGVWAVLIVAVAALGGFLPGSTGPVPAIGIAFAALLGAGLLAWAASTRFREALLGIPLPVLVGLNAIRLFGAFFLILLVQDRLPVAFASSAGWGDVAVALAAIPLALLAARRAVRPGWLSLWNGIGVMDLVAALALGVLSAPGTTFRVFTDGPGSTAIGTLPWALVPALFVPTFLLVHLAIATKLRRADRPSRMPAVAAEASA
jgi:hypothetical protein